MDTCFCEKSFIGRSFLVLEILKGGTLCPTPIPPWLHKSENAMVNRIYGHIEKSDLVVSVSRSDNFKKYAILFKKCADIFKKFPVIILKKWKAICRKCTELCKKCTANEEVNEPLGPSYSMRLMVLYFLFLFVFGVICRLYFLFLIFTCVLVDVIHDTRL